jgi:hypothetical protein
MDGCLGEFHGGSLGGHLGVFKTGLKELQIQKAVGLSLVFQVHLQVFKLSIPFHSLLLCLLYV